jgi:hypothetical protein
MTDAAPVEPLTPADCDLRDFPFMPLEIQRLRRSKAWLKAKRNPALAFYQINLWTAAWHDLPAGSLEDDDDVLADLAMCDVGKWPKVREEAMRGWVKCTDGRLYNPTVCEKALESWKLKLERLAKDEHERDRKRREREDRARMFALLKEHGMVPAWNTNTSELRKMVTDLSRGQDADSHGQTPGQSRLREGQGEREGQGQGEGQGEVKDTGSDSDGSTSKGEKPPRKRSGAAAQLVSLDDLIAEGVERQHAADWLHVRKKKDAPLTQTAWALIKTEAEAAAMSLDAVVKMAAENSWGSFRAKWLGVDASGARGKPMNKQEALEADNLAAAQRFADDMK